MAESEIPADIMDKAADIHRALKFSRDGDHLTEIIAQALLAERERAAKIVEDNMLCEPFGVEVLHPRTNPGNKVGMAYAAAIRQDNPNETEQGNG